MIHETPVYVFTYGICSSCRDPAVLTVTKESGWRNTYHYTWDTPSKRNPSCQHANKYGTIPEWAFFADEVLED